MNATDGTNQLTNTTYDTNLSSTAATASPESLTSDQTWLSVGTLVPLTAFGTFFVLILIAVRRDHKMFAGPYYTYLVNICIAELLALHYYGTYGSACIILGGCPVPLAVDQVVSSISWVLWYMEFIGDTMIGIDRFVAICFFKHYEDIFTPGVVKIASRLSTISNTRCLECSA